MDYKVVFQVISMLIGSSKTIIYPYIIEVEVEARSEEQAESEARIKAFKKGNNYIKNHHCGETTILKPIKIEKIVV